jgi:hypothetical protein
VTTIRRSGQASAADSDRLTALFYFPPGIRKAIYKTNTHQCDGIAELLAAKGAKESRSASEPRIDPEDFVSRRVDRLEEMEPADLRLEGCAQSIRHIIRAGASLIQLCLDFYSLVWFNRDFREGGGYRVECLETRVS